MKNLKHPMDFLYWGRLPPMCNYTQLLFLLVGFKIFECIYYLNDVLYLITLNQENKMNTNRIINVADIPDENGITSRQRNLLLKHDVPIGSLVEFLSDPENSDEDNENVGARLFVLHHSRDCDQTPLYDLGLMSDLTDFEHYFRNKEDNWHETQFRINSSIHFNIGRDCFKVIKRQEIPLDRRVVITINQGDDFESYLRMDMFHKFLIHPNNPRYRTVDYLECETFKSNWAADHVFSQMYKRAKEFDKTISLDIKLFSKIK